MVSTLTNAFQSVRDRFTQPASAVDGFTFASDPLGQELREELTANAGQPPAPNPARAA